MKKFRQLLSSKIGPYTVGIAFVILVLISNSILNRSEPKITRQISSSSDDAQELWTRKMYLRDYIADWESNTIYVVESTTDKLLAIDSLTGETNWRIYLAVSDKEGEFNQYGVRYLLTGDQTVFTVTSSYVNAYRASTGELLWFTKLGHGHISIYAQKEDSLIRVYYGNKIFEVSQASGEILSVQPKDDIVWIQNNVEVHCPLTPAKDGAVERCWVGLIGVDRSTGKILWKNNKPVYSEYYQEQSVNNMVFVEYPGEGICSLNPNIGEYAWCFPESIISNIVIDNDRKIGYFIRHDFSLVKTNLLTGGILAETKFLPMALPVGMQRDSYGYRVAVTKDTVIVSFGDSDQTFGLSFNR